MRRKKNPEPLNLVQQDRDAEDLCDFIEKVASPRAAALESPRSAAQIGLLGTPLGGSATPRDRGSGVRVPSSAGRRKSGFMPFKLTATGLTPARSGVNT